MYARNDVAIGSHEWPPTPCNNRRAIRDGTDSALAMHAQAECWRHSVVLRHGQGRPLRRSPWPFSLTDRSTYQATIAKVSYIRRYAWIGDDNDELVTRESVYLLGFELQYNELCESNRLRKTKTFIVLKFWLQQLSIMSFLNPTKATQFVLNFWLFMFRFMDFHGISLLSCNGGNKLQFSWLWKKTWELWMRLWVLGNFCRPINIIRQ